MTTIDYVIQITDHLIELIESAKNTRNFQSEGSSLLTGSIISLYIPFKLPSDNVILFSLYMRTANDIMDISSTFILSDKTNNTKITIDVDNAINYRYKIDNKTINHLKVTFEEYEELRLDPIVFSLSVFNFNKQIIKDSMNHCPKVLETLSTLKHIV